MSLELRQLAHHNPVKGSAVTIDRFNQAQRLHDLRNSANTVVFSVAAARRLLETGDGEKALAFLIEAETSCRRFCELLNGQVSALPDVGSGQADL